MKRFLLQQGGKAAAAKEPRVVEEDVGPGTEPRVFATWNANKLAGRLRDEQACAALARFLEEAKPDVLLLQETWCRAAAGSKQGRLGDGKSKDAHADADAVRLALRPGGVLGDYVARWSCRADGAANSGVGALVRRGVAKPRSVRASLEPPPEGAACGSELRHHPEGRVLILEFESLVVVSTYVPNCGWTADKHALRQQWDRDLGAFLRRRDFGDKPMVWAGDLNVSREDVDVSHADWFGKQWEGSQWSSQKGVPKPEHPPQERLGQPGFTPFERSGFSENLRIGGLTDAWRHMHPDARNYTWRGRQPTSKFYNKGMRLDYFAVSQAILPRLRSVELWPDRAGCSAQDQIDMKPRAFLGSDHCPVVMELHDPAAQPAPAAVVQPPPPPPPPLQPAELPDPDDAEYDFRANTP